MWAIIEAIWRAPETGQARESRLTNLPGFCPAVYPPRFYDDDDAVRTASLGPALREEAGTLDAHLRWPMMQGVCRMKFPHVTGLSAVRTHRFNARSA